MPVRNIDNYTNSANIFRTQNNLQNNSDQFDSSNAVQHWRSKNIINQILTNPCQFIHQPCLGTIQVTYIVQKHVLTKLKSKWTVASNEMQKLATSILLFDCQ